MVKSGYILPNNKLVLNRGPSISWNESYLTGDATNAKPGKLVANVTDDSKVKVADGVSPLAGILAYEETYILNRPINQFTIDEDGTKVFTRGVTKAYETNQEVAYLIGEFIVPLYLQKGFVAKKDDVLFGWSDGNVVPGRYINGIPAIRVPFTKNATEKSTEIAFAAGMNIRDVFAEVITGVADSTIDVGILSTEAGGDADGLLDGVSCATAGFVEQNLVDAATANITLGSLLTETKIKSSDATALFAAVKKPLGHACNGTAKTLSYTTSNHDIAGNLWVLVEGEGIREIGIAEEAKDAFSAEARIISRYNF